MQTIRGRLTLYYLVALTVTLGLFATALYLDQRQAVVQEAQMGIENRLADDADFALRYLRIRWEAALDRKPDSARRNGIMVELPPSLVVSVAPLGGGSTHTLIPEARAFLKGMRSWIYLTDRDGQKLFVSDSLNSLDSLGKQQIQQLVYPRPLAARQGQAQFSLDGASYNYWLQPVMGTDTAITTMLVVARPVVDHFGPGELLRSIALIAPLILIASTLLGYWLAGRSLRPLDLMVEELEAVQDGRSLHRRLGVPAGRDELSRLARTLNAMLGRVEQSFMALRRFTADASHELKTPLMVLRAGVERSLTHPKSPREVVVALDETLEQVNRMAELVGNLLTLARADEGRASLVMVKADLRALVLDVGETAEILGDEQGMAAIKTEVPHEAVLLMMDPARVRELLLNLVTNAIKYTPAGGEVVIRLLDQGASVVLEVQDNGIGIAPGDLTNIFERFWRVDQVRTREGGRPGTGLGLAISKWIAEAHGGTIQVRSRPGRGSTFTVILPGLVLAEVPPVPETSH